MVMINLLTFRRAGQRWDGIGEVDLVMIVMEDKIGSRHSDE